MQTQKVEKGTDPKSVVCAFFKAGQCGKGDKCKFSHDLTVERKVEKRSLYVDMRDDDDDTMDNWNDEKLKEVVDQKHGKEKRMPTTDIVSGNISYRTQSDLNEFNSILFSSDLQVFLGRGRKIEIRVVLGMSQWRIVHISACIAYRLCAEEG